MLEKSDVSREAEESMLNKLKIEHGLKEVQRMSSMMNDISLSKEIREEFQKSQSGNKL